jgi:hypothetical protein
MMIWLIPSVRTSVGKPIDLGVGSDISSQWNGELIRALAEDEGVDILLIVGGSRDPLYNEVVIGTVKCMKTCSICKPCWVGGRGTRAIPF